MLIPRMYIGRLGKVAEVPVPWDWRSPRNSFEEYIQAMPFAAKACQNKQGGAYLAYSGSQVASSPNYELDRFSCLHAMQNSPEQMAAR